MWSWGGGLGHTSAQQLPHSQPAPTASLSGRMCAVSWGQGNWNQSLPGKWVKSKAIRLYLKNRPKKPHIASFLAVLFNQLVMVCLSSTWTGKVRSRLGLFSWFPTTLSAVQTGVGWHCAMRVAVLEAHFTGSRAADGQHWQGSCSWPSYLPILVWSLLFSHHFPPLWLSRVFYWKNSLVKQVTYPALNK